MSKLELKEIGKSFVGRTAKNPLAWQAYKLCGRASDALGRIYGHARYGRELGERDETIRRLTRELFPDLTVRTGPFRGLKYQSAQSYGSALLPKLLGSYESELHPVLEELLSDEHSTVIDIGCAEGYYAVGLGLRQARANIWAFDVDSRARWLCSELARLNGVEGRLQIGGFCDQARLRSLPFGEKALIICDCEGYEDSLFTDGTARLLAGHDLIVETHDFIDIGISSRLRNIFQRTHRVRSIKSTDDIEKALTYQYEQLESHDMQTRRLILAERRPAIMEWLVMTGIDRDR